MKEITFKRIKLLNKNMISEGVKVLLQIVVWGDNKPCLENRTYYKKDDEWKCGKLSSFKYDDFKIILDNKNKIKKYLKGQSNDNWR